jgi:hypothetical protein
MIGVALRARQQKGWPKQPRRDEIVVNVIIATGLSIVGAFVYVAMIQKKENND